MTAAELIERLEGVRKSGRGWLAKCPAHSDKRASLSIADGDDGRILLHCFAECSAFEIVSAIGLALSDLFPPRLNDERREPMRPAHNYRDLLRAIEGESLIVALAAADIAAGRNLTDRDMDRLIAAQRKISRIVEVAA